MGRPSVVVVSLTVLFHIIAFGLSLGAESRRTTVTWQFDATSQYYYCHYKLDIASGLAAAGFIFNLLSFFLIMCMTKCYCCAGPHKASGNRFCAIFSLLLLIICFIIAESCLLAGANRNQLRTKDKFLSIPECETISKGIFAAAAAFTFFCLILSLFYYVSAAKSEDDFTIPVRTPTVGMTMFQQSAATPYSL